MSVNYVKQISIRWSDIDPNLHLRHSVYYDFGAQHRIEILEEAGLSISVMQSVGFGPIVFREECVFKREIRFSDVISIHTKLVSLSHDASRWTLQHEFYNLKGILCALITIDGAWMDIKLRKLCNPTPQVLVEVMNNFPKSEIVLPG